MASRNYLFLFAVLIGLFGVCWCWEEGEVLPHVPEALQPLLREGSNGVIRVYFVGKICEPLICSAVKEVGWMNGLKEVNTPEEADVVFALVMTIKCELISKTIKRLKELNIKDVPVVVLDYNDARKLKCGHIPQADFFFKRSMIDRDEIHRIGVVHNYRRDMYYLPFSLKVEFGKLMREALNEDPVRNLDICCFFGSHIQLDKEENPNWSSHHRYSNETLMRVHIQKVLKNYKQIHPNLEIQIGEVTQSGKVGRTQVNPRYVDNLSRCKIVVTSNPGKIEGDHRTLEAVASGGLAMVDEMVFPPPGLKHKQNMVFYNRETLVPLLDYYTSHPEEAREIGKAGFEEAVEHHLPQHLIYNILATVAAKLTNKTLPEFAVLVPATPSLTQSSD